MALVHQRRHLEGQYQLFVGRLVEQPGCGEVPGSSLGEVLRPQHPDVVAVDRLGLLLVEARRVRVDVLDVASAMNSSSENTSRSGLIDAAEQGEVD